MTTTKKVVLGIGASIVTLMALAVAAVLMWGPLVGIYLIPPTPHKAGLNALEIMEQGIYADKPDWAHKKAEATEALNSVETWDGLVPVLDDAIKVAGGKHSFILTEEELDDAQSVYEAPTTSLNGGIATITLPGFLGTTEQGQAYADTAAQGLYQAGVCGVILDLRSNNGGDMGPMLAAVSPLLPDGTSTSFVIDSSQHPVRIDGGSVNGGGTPTSLTSYIGKLNVPVAILQSPTTASSGEQTLLAFRGIERVRTFGGETAGYASVNTVIPIYDKISMALTIGTTLDRNGIPYGEVPIPAEQPTALNEAPEAALTWLNAQGCK
ncbi:S41 family peptidase [Schaalia sp. Marseille-Q2122]|uniref:S41 family peptidase n=1 Tax=Schaalia sp. Marseille-Q2122 TaxID=2736604 RepID=UPI00158AE24E|nr:S41 family peptidase [Schaalia sp. Marseille-Q2122]